MSSIRSEIEKILLKLSANKHWIIRLPLFVGEVVR